MFKRSPAMSYMYGSFKPTELPRKEPKERVRRQAHKAVGERKEPEKVKLFNILAFLVTHLSQQKAHLFMNYFFVFFRLQMSQPLMRVMIKQFSILRKYSKKNSKIMEMNLLISSNLYWILPHSIAL